MTTITKATLSNKAAVFIRDVLRTNLTDTQVPVRAGTAWIFKSEPDKKEIDAPFVILNVTSESRDNISMSRAKSNTNLSFDVLVWARKISDRDTIGDQIISVLSNPASTDGTDSILSKRLFYLNSTKSVEDAHTSDFPDLHYIMRVSVNMSYGGP